MIFPVTALGPGKRVGIWTIGCYKRCEKCANPELRIFDETKDIKISDVSKMLKNIPIDEVSGITISGGEPFAQAKGLKEMLTLFSSFCEDILVFSGYTYEELKLSTDNNVRECLEYIDVLIAGEYIDQLNDNQTALVGSSNQEIHFLNTNLESKYQKYMGMGRQIQNVFYGNDMMSIGIHNRLGASCIL